MLLDFQLFRPTDYAPLRVTGGFWFGMPGDRERRDTNLILHRGTARN